MITKINHILAMNFNNENEVLDYYRKVLPYRTREYHQDEIGPIIPENNATTAKNFLNKIFSLGGYTVDMSQGINWYATPTGDLEWNGGLVRHGHLVVMANEYVRTGNDLYAQEIINQMLHYIENIPVFDPIDKPYLEYKSSTWRPFEAPTRMGETWPEALGKIINSNSISGNDFCKVLLSIHQHGEFIRMHHWKTGNHAVGEVASLGIVSIFFEEFNFASSWRTYAVDFLMDM